MFSLKALLMIGMLVLLVACSQQEVSVTPQRETSTKMPSRATRATIVPVEPTTTPSPASPTVVTAPPTPTAKPTSTIDSAHISEPSATPGPLSAGALIQVSMDSQVGVLLDEIPTEMRDRVIEDILQQPDDFWLERARRQVRLTRNRLNFRDFIYEDKGQLPLPPERLWSISLAPDGPSRKTIQGHDLVMVGYTFTSTLLTDGNSPGSAEPALEEVGGVWQEPFVFPADPDLLLQRTDNACVNEGGFPPNSFDSENVWIFYDYECLADSGGAAGCHRTRLPRLSCREALEESVGEAEATMRFERIAWDSDMADAVRLWPTTSADAPDLMVVGEDLDTNRIIYRYIEPEDCALGEGSVGGSGWRRLLQFSATVHNQGGQPLNIGLVVAEDPINHVYTYNPCHDHFHYSNYGEFSLETQEQTQSSKQAFCVQSTSRFSNDEATPLTHNYSCRFQGIQTGWVDEYVAGLDSQWIDITDMEIPPDGFSVQLTFTSNGDRFLCEGTAVLDDNGDALWEPSGFTTPDGAGINRPQCDFISDWDVSNRASRAVFIPQDGSFVTAPCATGESGPLRNCGFDQLLDIDPACTPGAPVERTFRLEDAAPSQVLRVCEWSALLESGVACTFEDSIVNTIVGTEPAEVSFTCPQIRDEEELAGGYALYSAPVWPPEGASRVFVLD